MTYPACRDCGEPDSGTIDGRCRDCDNEHVMANWAYCECGTPLVSDVADRLGFMEEQHTWDCPKRPLRVIVCGSRSWNDGEAIARVLGELPRRSTIVHGACPKGADALADAMIEARRLPLKVEHHPADWDKHGKAAGPIRNGAMLGTKPDLVIAFWDGQSRGTADMVRRAERAGVKVKLVQP